MNRSCLTHRGVVLLLAVSTFCPALQAGFLPEQNLIDTHAEGAYLVHTADLDGDGDLDVLSASYSYDSEVGRSAQRIIWYANNGTGHFGTQRVITTVAYAVVSVYAADFNGDGELDVLWASNGDGKIAWCANDGSGHFGPQQVIATVGSYMNCVCVADLDGDNDLDVLLAWCAVYDAGLEECLDNKIGWYANDGSGNFGPQQVINTLAAGWVYAADLDGDADLDVLSASGFYDGEVDGYFAKIVWYANDGSGGFGPQQVIIAKANGDAYDVADLDGDSDLDILSACYGETVWYANDGSGRFGTQQMVTAKATGARSWYVSSVHTADLDGDHDLDVLLTSFDAPNSKLGWYANDGSGRFSSEQVISGAAGGIGVGDLDGDGDLDAVSASGDKIAWYRNDGTGHFGSHRTVSTQADGARSVHAADLDGDGDLDVLSASSDYEDDPNGKIAWYANDSSGHFGPQQVISTSAAQASCVYAADLDGDGDLDVLSASGWYRDWKIWWYANDGSGHFGPQQVITTEAYGAWCVYAADLDGDGDLDVLSASSGDDKIAWYENDGSAQFGHQQVITTATDYPYCVYATDLDGDGDVDVLSASSNDRKIAWYENDGSGQFGPQQVIPTAADYPHCVYAADLDGDGDVDVLSASGNLYWPAGKIAWYANDGSGQFGPQQVITTAVDGGQSVYAADLDGDGDMDVLSASSGDDKIAWYANDGAGQFGPQQVISIAALGAKCVYAADLDGDGDLDVLSASEWDDKIAWYENE